MLAVSLIASVGKGGALASPFASAESDLHQQRTNLSQSKPIAKVTSITGTPIFIPETHGLYGLLHIHILPSGRASYFGCFPMLLGVHEQNHRTRAERLL